MRCALLLAFISPGGAFLQAPFPRHASWNSRVTGLKSSVWPEEPTQASVFLRNLQDFALKIEDSLFGRHAPPATDEAAANEHAIWLQMEKLRKREMLAEKTRQWDVEAKLGRLLKVSCGRLTEKETAEVCRLFSELEVLGKDKDQQAEMHSLEGTWKLLFSSGKKAFPLPARLAGALKCSSEVISSLSAAQDVVSLRLPGLPLRVQVSVDGRIVTVGDRAIEVAFQRPALSLGPLRLPYGRPATARLTIVHSSAQFRLMRTADGEMLVFGLKQGSGVSGSGGSSGKDKLGAAAAAAPAPAEAVVEAGGKATWVWPL